MKDSGDIILAKKIREFELKILREYKEGKLPGTIHCCIGQELDVVRLIKQLKKGDIITSNHRCHGHFLAYSENFDGLYKELHKQPSGVNQGRCLSQHIHQDDFYTTGVQGGLMPIACGMALAEKMKDSGNIVVCFIGDGTLGQGVLYESLNLASLWQLPILFVLENNQYSMSTSVKDNAAGCIRCRFECFGLKECWFNFDEVLTRDNLPMFMIIDTYRYCGHSGNDDRCYRTQEEENEWIKKDKLGGYLLDEFLHQ